MYSRKYIRSYPVSAPAPLPAAASIPMEGRGAESEEMPLPPDYTGIAFQPRGARRDYPETVIASPDIPHSLGRAEGTAEDERRNQDDEFREGTFPTIDTQAHLDALRPEAGSEQEDSLAEDGATAAVLGEEEEFFRAEGVDPHEAIPLGEMDGERDAHPITEPTQWSLPASDPPESMHSEEEETPAPDQPPIPLITPALLRSLTLEDLLLFWMLLLLLSGDAEDQIYLLLGILLFMGR